ncbi:hypothetical protein F511_42564 [Dorcoceras hygrometricum]|uniref:Acyl-CoA dehydrogenase-related protein n=1 Tax=Dorcoceras hygrometricum TaxID=472368 RepID=A0A2Z7AA03_9LAMI|nr:hypothetical protein F511_42564 [Dorcoceras hygrometricum]
MVVDLIGIYGLKGPYCTLTTTDWFLQALSVIPRGSWGDVARRFTMIRWAAAAAAADLRRKFVSGQFDEENPFVLISSALLVQPDEGVSDLVMDRIGRWKRAAVRRLGRALVAASREVLRTLAPFLPTAARHGRRMLALSCDDGQPKHAAGCASAAASFSCGGGASGGRRSGESPAMS